MIRLSLGFLAYAINTVAHPIALRSPWVFKHIVLRLAPREGDWIFRKEAAEARRGQ